MEIISVVSNTFGGFTGSIGVASLEECNRFLVARKRVVIAHHGCIEADPSGNGAVCISLWALTEVRQARAQSNTDASLAT